MANMTLLSLTSSILNAKDETDSSFVNNGSTNRITY